MLFLSRKSKVGGNNGGSSTTNGIGGGGGLVEGYERGPVDASSGLKMTSGNGSGGLRSRSVSGSSVGNENGGGGGNGQGVSYQSITAAEQQQQPPPRNPLKDSNRLDENGDPLHAPLSSSPSPTSLPVPPASIMQLLRSPPVGVLEHTSLHTLFTHPRNTQVTITHPLTHPPQ